MKGRVKSRTAREIGEIRMGRRRRRESELAIAYSAYARGALPVSRNPLSGLQRVVCRRRLYVGIPVEWFIPALM